MAALGAGQGAVRHGNPVGRDPPRAGRGPAGRRQLGVNPLRRRVQQVVDRRFNRARYDADQMVTAFAARLKDIVDLDSVRQDLAGVVH
jgi:hypothetical protein